MAASGESRERLAMKEQGWIKLHRKIREGWIWQDHEKLKWWMDLLLEANHEDHQVLIGNTLYMCERGQTIKSLKTWAKRWGVHPSRVRRFLNLLQKDSMVIIKTDTQTTRLTVCAYDQYQGERHTDESKPKHKRTSDGKRMHTNNNDLKKEENENKPLTDSDFEMWYKEYPKKVGRQVAIAAWGKAKSKPPVNDMIDKLRLQRLQDQWKKDGGQFIPNPATYLNQGRWEDEIDTTKSNRPKFTQ